MPVITNIREDKLLSNLSVRYSVDSENFIARKISTNIPVKVDTDKYRIYARSFRIPETIRADSAVAREYQFEVSTASYVLEHHALKDYVSKKKQQNYEIGDLLADTTEVLTEAIDLRLEKKVADLFTTTSWSLNVSLASTAVWTAQTTVSNPIPLFDTGASEIVASSGRMPNYGIVVRDGFVAAKNHISVLDRVKYTSREMSKEMLAALFGLPQLYVPHTQYDTSAFGATESLESIWENNIAFLGYKEPSARLKGATGVALFEKKRQRVKRWVDRERDDADVVEVNQEYSPKIIASLTGFLIKDTV